MAWPATPSALDEVNLGTLQSFGDEGDPGTTYREAVEDSLNDGEPFATDPPLPVNRGTISIGTLNNPRRVTVEWDPNRTTTWAKGATQHDFTLYDPTGEVLYEESVPVDDRATDHYSVGPIELNYRGQYVIEITATHLASGGQTRIDETMDIGYADLPEPGYVAGVDEEMWGDPTTHADPNVPLTVNPIVTLNYDGPTTTLTADAQVHHNLWWDTPPTHIEFNLWRYDGLFGDTRLIPLTQAPEDGEILQALWDSVQASGLHVVQIVQYSEVFNTFSQAHYELIDTGDPPSGDGGGPPAIVGGVIGGVGKKP
jgi:hypothetical protein